MSDIRKLSVYDGRVVQEPPAYSVQKGALSLTNAPFNAIAATSSQMTFNIQVPSLNVFMDRELQISTGVNCRMNVAVAGVDGAPAVADTPVIVFGKDCALAPFSLQSLMTTSTATINDAVTTLNVSDVLYETLRFVDQKHNRSQRTTPTMLDKYAKYDTAVGAINNPLSSYFDAVDTDNIPNGAFYDVVFTDATGSPLSGNGAYNDGTNNINYTNGVPVLTNGGGGNALANYGIFFRFRVTEKLILSPFIFNEECGSDVGLFGVNNVQLVFNFGNGVSRVIRNAPVASGDEGRTVSAVQFLGAAPFVNPRCNVTFLTPPLDIALPPKSIVPYLEYPRYISTPGQEIASGSSATLATQTITLPQIPDMLLIYAKPQSYSPQDGDFYFPIDQISINFDNYAGLLSSHTPEQLYNMSYDNGLEMDWNTWSGRARVVNTDAGATAPGSAEANNVPLVGGFLALKPGKDITLQSGMASGVVGNFTFQANVRVNNYTDAAATPIIYVVAINSGFFETQSGSSRLIKGPLTEQDVISAPPASANTMSKLRRVIGGKKSVFSSMLSALGKIASNPAVQKLAVDGVRKMTGLGVTGGMVTGGKASLNRLM